jgi:hypothetical protein
MISLKVDLKGMQQLITLPLFFAAPLQDNFSRCGEACEIH